MFQIKLNQLSPENNISEIYSKNIEYMALTAKITKYMERYKLAEFKMVFPHSDDCYKYLDVSYDFLSILDRLFPLLSYLKSGQKDFNLLFYESYMSLYFQHISEDLYLSVFKNDVLIVKLKLNRKDIHDMVEDMINNFKKILEIYLPKGYDLLHHKYKFFDGMASEH